MATINLGDKVRDRMTGFAGIVIGIHNWLYGCTRVSVQPEKLQEGKVVDPQIFDEPQLEVLNTKNFLLKAPASDVPGGPRNEPGRRAVPSRR